MKEQIEQNFRTELDLLGKIDLLQVERNQIARQNSENLAKFGKLQAEIQHLREKVKKDLTTSHARRIWSRNEFTHLINEDQSYDDKHLEWARHQKVLSSCV